MPNDDIFTVLIVEDEPLICAGLAEKIPWSKYNFRVCDTARNGVEAAEIITASKPDVILADIRMPRMDGLELAAWIRNNHYDVEIILLTGYSDFNYAREAIKHDVAAYLLKPLEHNELAEAIKKITSKLQNKNKAIESDIGQTASPVANLEQVDVGLVERVKKFIEDNYIYNINLKTVAAHVEVNYTYLSRVFAQKAGCDFSEYLNALRMKKAMQLLKETNHPVSSVARLSGYTNVKYFYKLFKNKTGYTTKEFRTKS